MFHVKQFKNMNFIYLIYNYFKRNDELFGIWTREDDGSGLLNIFGWSLKFEKNNKLTTYFWENKKEVSNVYFWERISKNTIEISSDKENWKINYEIQTYKGAFHYYFKLIEKEKNSFFNSPEPLFKRMY